MESGLTYLFFPIFVMASAHCIGDYPMQGEFLAKYKSESRLVMFVHSIIYTAFIMIGFYILYLTGYYCKDWDLDTFTKIAYVVLMSHMIIDTAKCVYRKELYKVYPDLDDSNSEGHKYDVFGYYADQITHFIVLLIVSH